MANVLYIHGMGGGSDSRIPSILQEILGPEGINVIARTYDFDPEKASGQIAAWVRESDPSVVVGESLGALHALRIEGVPRLFVSPALNTPFYFEALAWLTILPGVTWLFDRIYRPKEGDRQNLHFTFSILRKYLPHRRKALKKTPITAGGDSCHAFFGTRDHYRRSGIVSIRTWEKHFGKTYTVYQGSHFMEDEYVRSILADSIRSFFQDKL